MKKKLTALNATIATAAVEVKTLTISGKQVTLAVFRQLQDRDLINRKTLDFTGIPWGTVNYHPDRCGDEDTHLHVIWQYESNLFRAAVFKDQPPSWPRVPEMRRVELGRSLLPIRDASVCPKCGASIISFRWDGQGGYCFICLQGCSVSRDRLDSLEREIKTISIKRQMSGDYVSIRERLLKEAQEVDFEEIGQYEQLVIERSQWFEKYKSQYALLESLDQLFIAV